MRLFHVVLLIGIIFPGVALPGPIERRSSVPEPLREVGLEARFSSGSMQSVRVGAGTLRSTRVAVTVQDSRGAGSRAVIGRSSLYGEVTTREDVARWCSAQSIALLKAAGVTISDDPDLLFQATINQLVVDEESTGTTSTYLGRIVIRVVVTDRSHKEIWKGLIIGTARNWGNSYSLKNHQESLSDTLANTWTALFDNPQFGEALDGWSANATSSSP